MIKNIFKTLIFTLALVLFGFGGNVHSTRAASPTAPYFELCVSPVTGGDCSGDGAGLKNEFYVGQTFDTKIMLSTGGQAVRSANAIIQYDPTYLQVNDASVGVAGTQISGGTIFETYPNNGNTVQSGTIRLTGANLSGATYTGSGIFGTISFTVLAQREVMFGTTSPLGVTFDYTPGSTTDSNIVRAGDSVDILNAVENAQWYLWPDTEKPFVNNINHENDTDVSVEDNLTFHFKDTNVTSGDETGVDTSTLQVLINSGSGFVDRTGWATFSCSGTWSNNDCLVTVNPADTGNRNWNYATTYQVRLQNGQDRASLTQNPAGPNIMDTVNFAFTTEADTEAPHVSNNTPTGSNAATSTNISFRISDTKLITPTIGTYGSGVNSSTIRVDAQSTSTNLNTYQCGDGKMTCSAVTTSGLTWAYDVTINPAQDFAQNEQIFVTVRDAQDYANPVNTMTNFNWSFWTTDATAPQITQLDPTAGAASLTATSHIKFHVIDTGVGVDINTLTVKIGDTIYTKTGANTFSYTGDSSDYAIEITPATSFVANTPVAITINVADLSSNQMTPFSYGVAFGDETCPELTGVCPPSRTCPADPVCPESPSCPAQPVCKDNPPTAPLNLRATKITSNSISLAWDASTDDHKVLGYAIYNAKTSLKIGSTINTAFDLTGLQAETNYQFYVKAYDVANQYSGPSNTLSVTTLKNLEDKSEDIKIILVILNAPDEAAVGQYLTTKVKVIVTDGGGNIITDYSGSVYFTSTDEKAKIVWRQDLKYSFTELDKGQHQFATSDIIFYTAGAQKLTITDGVTQASVNIKVKESDLTVALQKATDNVKNNDAMVKDAVVTTTAALLAFPVLVNLAIGFSSLFPQLMYWFGHLLQLLGIKPRRKPWGVIFNSQTGQPIAFAVVRIYDKEYNRLLESTITDSGGRFGFLTRPGIYYLVAQKGNFVFPSQYKVSGFFDNIYTGETIKIDDKKDSITVNIPLDPRVKQSLGLNLLIGLIKFNRFLQKISIPMLIAGSAFTIVMMFVKFDRLYVLSLVLYALIFVLQYVRSFKAKPYGEVTDIFGHPIETAIVRIFEKRTGRLFGTDVTDNEGRFHFLVNPGVYYLTAVKPGYNDFKSHIMYLEKEKTAVSSNIKMQKI